MYRSPLRLVVLLGSVRDGRFGPAVAEWFLALARTRTDLDVDLIDLKEHPLPLAMPGFAGTLHEDDARRRERLAARLAAADAFVVITPEYNHGFPAALKNFLDWFLDEWAAKPAGFVSYGGTGGGLRSVEQLRQVFAELHALTVRDGVSFHNAWERTTEDGRLDGSEAGESAAKVMLDELVWWGRALRRARTESPYPR
ncbi:NADPH-dependent FMN reductase [Streptomyces sp. NPDC059605]|uniref:NADPH-dependent FMN reductase n=1 Tax=unclassified Streptomyces TaxID=2593676 RepID=UPI0033BF82C3